MLFIYVLKCENNKYYIGSTKNLDSRINEHFNGSGSTFTKTFKPIQLIHSFNTFDRYDEDKTVKQYMSKYGIHNVRGASYSTIELSEETINNLQKEILHSRNVCFRCHKKGHFMKNCYAKSDINGIVLPSKFTKNNIQNNNIENIGNENDNNLELKLEQELELELNDFFDFIIESLVKNKSYLIKNFIFLTNKYKEHKKVLNTIIDRSWNIYTKFFK